VENHEPTEAREHQILTAKEIPMIKNLRLALGVVALLAVAVCPPAFAESSSRHSSHHKSQKVHGYVRKDGTYVSSYHRSKPDKSKANNYSSEGNINPYTGKAGTKSDN